LRTTVIGRLALRFDAGSVAVTVYSPGATSAASVRLALTGPDAGAVTVVVANTPMAMTHSSPAGTPVTVTGTSESGTTMSGAETASRHLGSKVPMIGDLARPRRKRDSGDELMAHLSSSLLPAG
jgi:hypothetical protein